MSYIDDLAEADKLAEYVRDGVTKIVDKFVDTTPRDIIVETVKKWVDNGDLVLRSQQGTRAEIANKVKDGLLFPTSYAGIMATQKEVRDSFEHYIDTNRIMDVNKVAVRKGLFTEYAINKACMSGELVRVANFANSLTLYVD